MVPHRKDAPAITLDRLQLLLQPHLLLIEHRATDIAVETDHPPVAHLGSKPGSVRRARAEVIQEILRRALHVVVIARDSVGSWQKLTPRGGVTGQECGPISQWVGGISNHENHRTGRNHLRGLGCRAARWGFPAVGNVTGRVREHTAPGQWSSAHY